MQEVWGGNLQPFRIVRDQASNGKKGVRQFYADTPPRPGYDGNDCICHVLDREVKETLKNGALGPLFEQQHKAIVYFKKSTKAGKELLEQQQKRLDSDPNYFMHRLETLGWNNPDSWVKVPIPTKPLKPLLGVATRWWSEIDENIRWILLEEPWLDAIATVRRNLKKKNKIAKAALLKFKERDLEALKKMVSILHPFKDAIKELEGTTTAVIFNTKRFLGEKYPTYPRIVKWLAILREHLREQLRQEEGSHHFSDRVVQVIKDLRGAIDRCFEKLNDDAYLAALLHPGIRDTFFVDDAAHYWDALEIEYRYVFFLKHYSVRLIIFCRKERVIIELEVPDADSNQHPQQTEVQKKDKKTSIAEKFYKKKAVEHLAQDTEFAAFKALGVIEELQDSDGLSWWRDPANQSKFPTMTRLARRYLAIPASSAPSERVFSKYGAIWEKRRGNLNPETANDTIFLHERRRETEKTDSDS